MARQVPQRPARRKKRIPVGEIHFERRNFYVLGAGLAAIILGYILLAAGSMTAAPLLLVAGYCFLVPVSLLWRTRTSGAESQPAEPARLPPRPSPGTRPRETTPRP